MEDEIMTNEQYQDALRKTKYETLDELLIKIESYEDITIQEVKYIIKAMKKELSSETKRN